VAGIVSAHAAPVAIPGEAVTGAFPLPSKEGDPLANLPPRTRVISSFGERAVFSPDGNRVAFVERAYGDVFEYDLRTGAIRNLTAHIPNSGFLRVHYMKDGSYLLLGPRKIGESREETRRRSLGARSPSARRRFRSYTTGAAAASSSARACAFELSPTHESQGMTIQFNGSAEGSAPSGNDQAARRRDSR